MNDLKEKKNELIYLRLKLINEYTDYFIYYKSWWMAIYATGFYELYEYKSKKRTLHKDNEKLD